MKPLWKGPEQDGITQSMLQKFLECRHRFYLRTVHGLVEDEGFKAPLEYGNLWHEAEEAFANGDDWEVAIRQYYQKLKRRYPGNPELYKWYQCCLVQFDVYRQYWKSHYWMTKREPIFQEENFAVPYELPSGRWVTLRGKFDAVDWVGNQVYLQENKTKADVDTSGLKKSLPLNLQSMFYQVALRQGYDWGGHRVGGTLYNVIKRPLGRFGPRPTIKSGTMENGQPNAKYFKKLEDFLRDNAKDWFYRWDIELYARDVLMFRKRMLDPILDQLCEWWDWIAENPETPFRSDSRGVAGGGYHWITPHGMFNSLSQSFGIRGDYFEYMTTGEQGDLKQIKTLYPELETNHGEEEETKQKETATKV